MIQIKLEGGPRDGDFTTIPMDVWRSGLFRVAIANTSLASWSTILEPCATMPYDTVIYRKQRWHPGWSCIVEGEPMYACEPIHRWLYEKYKW